MSLLNLYGISTGVLKNLGVQKQKMHNSRGQGRIQNKKHTKKKQTKNCCAKK